MKLTITTTVRANYLSIKNDFTEELFLKLTPSFPPVRLLRFDGCKKGDIVTVELNFIFFKQKWTSHITADNTDDNIFEFTDEGTVLPFFLRSWKHHHQIHRIDDTKSRIVDAIEFSTSTLLTDYLLFPALWFQFLYRKPIYRKILRSD